jgi:hypothetical protein
MLIRNPGPVKSQSFLHEKGGATPEDEEEQRAASSSQPPPSRSGPSEMHTMTFSAASNARSLRSSSSSSSLP